MIPNFKNKYKYESITTAKEYIKRYGKAIKFRGETGFIIYPYSKKFFLDVVKNKRIKIKEKGKFFVLNDKLICCVSQIGSPNAGISVEEMRVYGVKKIINVGIAGGISKDLRIGDVVLCNKALRDEGTSYHYLKPSKYVYPSAKFLKFIKDQFKKNRIPFKTSATWTTDAPYRETLEEVKKYTKEGILTVDMEASAIFSVTKYYGFDSVSIFVISDLISSNGWKHYFYSSIINMKLKKIFDILLYIFL